VPNPWTWDFYKSVEDFWNGVLDTDQFKAKLIELGFPDGYVSWLIYMMERE
jgi:hypothetical protein